MDKQWTISIHLKTTRNKLMISNLLNSDALWVINVPSYKKTMQVKIAMASSEENISYVCNSTPAKITLLIIIRAHTRITVAQERNQFHNQTILSIWEGKAHLGGVEQMYNNNTNIIRLYQEDTLVHLRIKWSQGMKDSHTLQAITTFNNINIPNWVDFKIIGWIPEVLLSPIIIT